MMSSPPSARGPWCVVHEGFSPNIDLLGNSPHHLASEPTDDQARQITGGFNATQGPPRDRTSHSMDGLRAKPGQTKLFRSRT